MTYVLAGIFASLFAKGFGIPEDQVKESECETRQDASGTGMGEGAGLNDVSDQINNEDQLLGTSEKVWKPQGYRTFYVALFYSFPSRKILVQAS